MQLDVEVSPPAFVRDLFKRYGTMSNGNWFLRYELFSSDFHLGMFLISSVQVILHLKIIKYVV